MQLTSHFTLAEMIASDTARERGLDNTPPADVIENLKRMAAFLETVRATLGGHPMQITSGYRCPDLNKAVGGVVDSSHLSGLAVDFVCPDMGSPFLICSRLRGTPGLAFDQLINEANSRGHRWVHLGIAAAGKEPRGEVWTVDTSGTRPGL